MRKESSRAGPWYRCSPSFQVFSQGSPKSDCSLPHGLRAHPASSPPRSRSCTRSTKSRCTGCAATGRDRGGGGGTGCSEQKGSTSPGSSPTPPLLPLRDWLSGKQVAICSPNSHKTGSSDPGRKATCAMRIRGCVFKKGNREETTRSPFSCRQIR